jgi:hypothetical protein
MLKMAMIRHYLALGNSFFFSFFELALGNSDGAEIVQSFSTPNRQANTNLLKQICHF